MHFMADRLSILTRWILIVLGSIFVAIAVVGIFVPLLPTTDFLLLAAACYIRSSDKMYNKLINNPVFGPAIKNYSEKRGMSNNDKIKAIAGIWIFIAISAVFFIEKIWLDLTLYAIALGVSLYLLSLKKVK